MRTPWLLISIAVHGAAITAALGFGVLAQPSGLRPPARVAIQPRAATQPEVTQDDAIPDVVAEPPVADGDLPAVEMVLPVFEVRPLEQTVVVDQLMVSPSAVLQRATLERFRKPAPKARPMEVPVPVPAEPEPIVAPPAPVQQAWSEARERSDNEPPRYPERERRLQREGTVVVTVSIDAQGVVQDVSLRTSSRYSGFNREALRAVRKWRFEPATRGGVAVESATDIEVVFRLRDE